MHEILVLKSEKISCFQRLQKKNIYIRAVLILLVLVWATSVIAQPVKTSSGIIVTCNGKKIELAAVKDFAFRISVCTGVPTVINSIFLDNDNSVSTKFSVINESPVYGIKTSFGELIINAQSNVWSVFDAKGKYLIENGSFTSTDSLQTISFSSRNGTKFYGAGNYSTKDLIKHKSASALGNGTSDIPYLWSNCGYSLFGATNNDNRPAQWKADAAQVTWTFFGAQADLYIWPAENLYDASKGFAQLTGKPKLPPLWAFGYLQSQWGWQNKAYIEDVLKNFHTRNLPVDAFIYDFEWYTKTPDYSIGKSGEKDFTDFSFNPKLFPEPAQQIAEYKKQGIKFIGIRKPRLGNTDNIELARKNGWLIHPESDSRDLDFSIPSLQKWYDEKMEPLLKAGVDAWWDDEGESYYSCYYWWNKSEVDILGKAQPNERHFSINRSFSPGTQRLGYCTWSGDIKSDWKDLQEVPADLLNFSLAGMNYGSCDIGGFRELSAPVRPTKETIVRWFEAGVFLPIMRAHSNVTAIPHFPWLWGEDAEAAIRKALNLRYRLIPFLYSLGHEAYNTGIPMMRPLVMEFQNDTAVANLTDEWLLGKGLLAAPVLDSGGTRNVYLPHDTWYDFNTGKAIKGPVTFSVTKTLDEIPVYVRAGTILPLGPVIQHTGQATSEPLEIRIYPGHNASFILVEDDGKTYDYTKGIVRKTLFNWDDATKVLSWKITGNYSGNNLYKSVRIVLGHISKNTTIEKNGIIRF